MNSFLLALQFLTVIRIPRMVDYRPEDFSSSLRWFFLIGLLIGSIQWILSWAGLKYHFPVDLLAPLVLVAGLILTGGLHLDGMADSADGFGAGTDRESVLRIMKDDRIGVYGIAAIVLTLYVKIIAISYVLKAGQVCVILLSPMLCRALLSVTCTLLPYARSEGTGKAFAEGNFFKHAFPSLFLCVAIQFSFFRFPGLYVFGIVCLVGLLFWGYCYGRIRGFTGDTLGAQCEVTEIAALLSGSMLL
ncbi:adenosylcobinamide-GDP ribazoletransferase [bacterium]|nr:adenosylcobinamide-GDP ribazoletransferase [bacterium]